MSGSVVLAQNQVSEKLTYLIGDLRHVTEKIEKLSEEKLDHDDRVALLELNSRAGVYLHDMLMMLSIPSLPVGATLNFIDLVENFCHEVKDI